MSKLGKRGLTVVHGLSAPSIPDRQNYHPSPKSAPRGIGYRSKERLSDVLIDVKRKQMDAQAAAAMKEWLKSQTPEQRALLDGDVDP